ncbi:hypothetical protein FOXYSP1_17869 [Fusarium oxysporum f. sp. phaseoli]
MGKPNIHSTHLLRGGRNIRNTQRGGSA